MIDVRDIAALVAATRSGELAVAAVVAATIDALELARRPEAWICRVERAALRARAQELDAARASADSMPLFGVPFAVKDNIDVAGMPTTAGCPAYAYTPAEDAPVVAALLRAGAVLVGKTHMDQFATGLVGTRSPHGPCRNAHVADRISGGSSSGSAVAVAEGIVAFSLGTDTAGSGRVPAVLNGVAGLKPSYGRISTRGVVPACASLDCVSVFAASCEAAALVLAALDTGGVGAQPSVAREASQKSFRFGVPRELPEVVGAEAAGLFTRAVAALAEIGGSAVEIDYAPFLETAALLYADGPWLAERDEAFGDFLRAHPEAVDATVAHLVGRATRDAGRDEVARGRLTRLKEQSASVWKDIDVLVVPTVPAPFRIADVQARPLEASIASAATNNFVNLLDLAAVAVPTSVWNCGVPFGVTLCAPKGCDETLLAVGSRLGAATKEAVPRLEPQRRIPLAVVGAHLEGMPLHHQLTALDARLLARTRTAPLYRLYALANTSPPKPGLERVATGGAAIEVEVYALAPEAFGRFVAAVPRPLAIGRIALDGGQEVSGFVCEPEGLAGAEDITSCGGWRAWCGPRTSRPPTG